MHATKDEGVAFDNMGIMVTNKKKLIGVVFFKGNNIFRENMSRLYVSHIFIIKDKFRRYSKTLEQQGLNHDFGFINLM